MDENYDPEKDMDGSSTISEETRTKAGDKVGDFTKITWKSLIWFDH